MSFHTPLAHTQSAGASQCLRTHHSAQASAKQATNPIESSHPEVGILQLFEHYFAGATETVALAPNTRTDKHEQICMPTEQRCTAVTLQAVMKSRRSVSINCGLHACPSVPGGKHNRSLDASYWWVDGATSAWRPILERIDQCSSEGELEVKQSALKRSSIYVSGSSISLHYSV